MSITAAEAKKLINFMGLSCREKNGELRVSYAPDDEVSAYYTNDRMDAVMTAHDMYVRRLLREWRLTNA